MNKFQEKISYQAYSRSKILKKSEFISLTIK